MIAIQRKGGNYEQNVTDNITDSIHRTCNSLLVGRENQHHGLLDRSYYSYIFVSYGGQMNPKNNRVRGKRHQKKTAEMLNGLNIGTLGGADVLAGNFVVECKSRVKFVGEGWFKQAEKHCKKGQIPVVVIHIKGTHYDNDFVMVKMKDFRKLIGGEQNEQ